MGVVKMDETMAFISRGCPYHEATLYVYCDRCGSFDVKRCLGPRKWRLILVVGALVGAGIAAWVHWQGNWRGAWLAGPVVLAVAFELLWGDPAYRCRRCRILTSTRYNTLGRPPDPALVDVPDERIQKRSLGYWADQGDIDVYLRSPGAQPAGDKRASDEM